MQLELGQGSKGRKIGAAEAPGRVRAEGPDPRQGLTGQGPKSEQLEPSRSRQPALSGGRPAPITIYSALDFLRNNGLVHRIESRNAFVACVNNHATGDLVVFLICEHCGAVGEAPSAAMAARFVSSGNGSP